MEQVQNLLNEVNSKIQSLETAKSLYSEQLAPDFQVFDFVNTSENGLSWIIANLLNPKGTHGQKTLFLEQFIRICLPKIQNNTVWQNYLENLTQTEVETEATTWANQAYRRMDIYLSARINSETFGICIENKPYANDQENQLADYFLELENRKLSQKHLVYLCEYGEPSDYSVTKDILESWIKNQLISFVTYSQLVVWLTECKKDCQNHSVTEFLNQFIKFIRKQFMGVEDMNEENTVVEILLKDLNNLESAIKIYNAVSEAKNQLMHDLTQQLKAKIQTKPYELSYMNLGSQSYAGFGVIFPDTGIEFCFEFQSRDFNNLCIGYTAIDRKFTKGEKEFNETAQQIRETLSTKRAKTSPAWLGWYDYEYCNWDSDPKVWSKIQNGTLSEEIVREIDFLYQNLIDNNIKMNTKSDG